MTITPFREFGIKIANGEVQVKGEDRNLHFNDVIKYAIQHWYDHRDILPTSMLHMENDIANFVHKHPKVALLAVIDGHSTSFIPSYIQKVLPFVVCYELCKIMESPADSVSEQEILEACKQVPQTIHEALKSEHGHELRKEMEDRGNLFVGGACVSFVLITKDHVAAATLGDCRVALFVNGLSKQLPLHHMDCLNSRDIEQMMENNVIFNSSHELSYEQINTQGPKNRIGVSGLRPYGSIGDFVDDKDVFAAMIAKHHGNATKEEDQLVSNYVSFTADDKIRSKWTHEFVSSGKVKPLLHDMLERVPFVSVHSVKDVKWIAAYTDGGNMITDELDQDNLEAAFERDEAAHDDFSFVCAYFIHSE
ncbi:hypothetical protein MP638_004939 [Amoeboaphelidium occidentale]|nr:hypothetical protein MP638_004939 [Amoeboaphelidium occidentale]